MPNPAHSGFSSPFKVAIPAECEGWRDMYPYYAVFSEDRRAFDESRFWFHDGMHWPEPYAPFDALVLDSIVAAFNQASTRLFVVPSSLGVEWRLLNGYVYLSTNSVTDEATLAERKELFAVAAAFGNRLDTRGAYVQGIVESTPEELAAAFGH
jgi:pyruvate,water dikinase